MNLHQPTETDPRFPSGRWTGFYVQKEFVPGKHQMELLLTFRDGKASGVGRDWFGEFLVRGRYELASGSCQWTKSYVGKHDIAYRGYNEGKGIWGVWEIAATPPSGVLRGGFHIWPEGMADPSTPQLTEEADLPVHVEEAAKVVEPSGVPG